MLQVASIANYTPVQASLVNTPLPDSIVTRAPYDTVAPAISSAPVNNNASPNSEAAATISPAAAQSASANTPATFLAQLISQDGTPDTQNLLPGDAEQVDLTYVKYKPSNAGKPEDSPAARFRQLFQASQSTASAPAAAPAAPGSSEPAAKATVLPFAAPAQQTPAPAAIPSYQIPKAIGAYVATASRVTAQGLKSTAELA